MKNVQIGLLSILISLAFLPSNAKAQEQEIKQLLLDVEKLAQFKKILQDMYKGYEILKKGYTAIKDISEGSFNLHKDFLDQLLAVSPAVQKYKRVADIIDYQIKIIKDYKAAYSHFKNDPNFTSQELNYMGQVYNNLMDLCLKNLDDLATVTTAGKLRMSDNERLEAIDHIFDEIKNEYGFLQHFNNSAKILSQARLHEQYDIDVSKAISGH